MQFSGLTTRGHGRPGFAGEVVVGRAAPLQLYFACCIADVNSECGLGVL